MKLEKAIIIVSYIVRFIPVVLSSNSQHALVCSRLQVVDDDA